MKAALPKNEARRLELLHADGVLDTPAESAFDDIALLASQICGTPIALVSLIDESRQWFKARVGLEATETSRDVAFCAHAILQDGLFEVGDALGDERFRENPLVTADPSIRFYAGTPLVTEGLALGTLCVLDHVPRSLTDAQKLALKALGRQVVAQLDLRRSLRELGNAHELQRLFFSLATDLFCIVTLDGTLSELNQAWELSLGIPTIELAAKSLLDWVHPDDRAEARRQLRHLNSDGQPVDFENRLICRDGSYRWLHWSVAASHQTAAFYAVGRDVTERRVREDGLRRITLHDTLTGLANRTQLLDRLERELARAKHRPQERQVALVYLDLDGFKAVNDSLGHLAGDDLLVAVARRLEVCLRPGDMVARLGGDEFVVLLSGISNGAAAKQVAERFVKALSQPYRIDERDVRISASAGIALASKEHRQGADLLRAADEAMYRAKELGKCRAELYESPGGMPILPGKP